MMKVAEVLFATGIALFLFSYVRSGDAISLPQTERTRNKLIWEYDRMMVRGIAVLVGSLVVGGIAYYAGSY